MFVRGEEIVFGGSVAIAQPLELHLAHGGFHEATVAALGRCLLLPRLRVQVRGPAQNGQATLAHAGAGFGQMFKPQLLPQHVVNSFGQHAALARAQVHGLALVSEILGHHAVSGVFKT